MPKENKDKDKTNPNADISIDFTGVVAFGPLDPDVMYKAVISDVGSGNTDKGATVAVEFSLIAPEEVTIVDPDTDEKVTVPIVGRKISRTYSMVPAAMPFFLALLKAIGIPEAELKGPFSLKPATILGNPVALTVYNDVYQGEVRSYVGKVLPVAQYDKEQAKLAEGS